MSTFISMLRGINVSGQKRLPMDSLRELYTGLGFTAVQTYVQSGNVIFQASDDPVLLTGRLEQRIQEAYGYEVAVFIRQAEDFRLILDNNPFLTERHEDPTKLYVTFLYQAPAEAAWEKANPPTGISDEFARGDRSVYVFCPNGYGRTKLSIDFFEQKLGVQATTRNWNTVNALYQMAKV